MNSKSPKIKEIIQKIDIGKIANYSQEYPKSHTLKEIIRYSKRVLDSGDNQKIFKLAVKIAYNLDTICDENKTSYFFYLIT